MATNEMKGGVGPISRHPGFRMRGNDNSPQPAEKSFLALPIEARQRLESLEQRLLENVFKLNLLSNCVAHARSRMLFEARSHKTGKLVERFPLGSAPHQIFNHPVFGHGIPRHHPEK